MSWEVALFIALPLFFIIGNIMMVKHTAKMKMPSLKDRLPEQETPAEYSQTGNGAKPNDEPKQRHDTNS